MTEKIRKSDAEWKEELTPEEFEILRRQGTEPAFSGKYWDYDEEGVYRCAACGAQLFDSETKFKSGSGWPSFFNPADSAAVETREDHSLGMARTEVVCARCGSHLGHVFDDGPQPTGKRFCINSAALDFEGNEGGKARGNEGEKGGM